MASLSNDGPLPPLVIRNKRGRKVDETLPKSHQREVQRQFRARRAAHLLDLERRVAILERENLALRHWAGIQPATRYLLGRGPTGCDTTKPLIAEENDPEIQLIPENHSPNSSSNGASQEQNWPRTPTGARPSFVMDQQHQQQHQQHQHALPPAPESVHNPSYMDELRKPTHAAASFDKPPYNPTVPSFPPNAHKYKPHPLYDTRPFDHLPPAPPAHFDQQSRLDADRMIKRENVYAPPAPPGNLGSLPPRSDMPPASQGPSYYAVDARGPFSRPVDSYQSRESSGHHTDMPPTPMSTNATTVPNPPLYPQSTTNWSDQYAANPTPTPTPQMSTSRPQPVTPILPPTANGSVGNLSPASQATSNGSNSVPDSRVHGMGVVPGYEQRRSVSYVMGGYGVPTSSTPTPTSYMSNQGLTYPSHLDNSQQHDNTTLPDTYRQ